MEHESKPMDDVIYRQDAIDAIKLASSPCLVELNDTYRAQVKALKELPSARKKGHWVFKREEHPTYTVEQAVCSECGEPCAAYGLDKPRDRFCKWCGADTHGGASADGG